MRDRPHDDLFDSSDSPYDRHDRLVWHTLGILDCQFGPLSPSMLLYPLSHMPIVLITTDKALVLLLYTENAIVASPLDETCFVRGCNNKTDTSRTWNSSLVAAPRLA